MRRMKNIIQNYLISVILRLDWRIHVLSLWIARSSRAMTLLSIGFFISFALLAGCATPLMNAAQRGDVNDIKALKDGKKTIAEIYDYIKPLVEDEAKAINVQQSPSINPEPEKLKGRFGLRK